MITSETLKNSSAEFRNIIDNLPAAFKAAIIAQTATVTCLYYHGATAASEFLTYSNKKIYIALKLMNGYAGAPNGTQGAWTVYNEADAIAYYINLGLAYWDQTAAAVKYSGYTEQIRNIWFSRVAVSAQITSMMFNGYKIVIP